jgi:hypothetical protein
VHRASVLDPDDLCRVENLPVTAPARTLIDLAAVLPPADLKTALRRAVARGLVARAGLVARLDVLGSAGRPGAVRLRQAIVQSPGA